MNVYVLLFSSCLVSAPSLVLCCVREEEAKLEVWLAPESVQNKPNAFLWAYFDLSLSLSFPPMGQWLPLLGRRHEYLIIIYRSLAVCTFPFTHTPSPSPSLSKQRWHHFFLSDKRFQHAICIWGLVVQQNRSYGHRNPLRHYFTVIE